MRVVIDTNIWISFLIGKALWGLEKYLNKEIKIVTSDEQLQEIISVINRPKFKKYFSEEDIQELLSLLQKVSEIVTIEHTIFDCRDRKDNFILETALKGKVDIIVTGDKDLLVLNPYKGITIVTYKTFEQLMKEFEVK
ncbi:putative toxin-antitoxin system toxin component, PIN family [Deferribacter abyssi]|uniref:putative toxin-antitoxin system toxin component, PIN family n=1 Tax=Deferribacter abyssi TaxID=213806 RepID=UPI003C262058